MMQLLHSRLVGSRLLNFKAKEKNRITKQHSQDPEPIFFPLLQSKDPDMQEKLPERSQPSWDFPLVVILS